MDHMYIFRRCIVASLSAVVVGKEKKRMIFLVVRWWYLYLACLFSAIQGKRGQASQFSMA